VWSTKEATHTPFAFLALLSISKLLSVEGVAPGDIISLYKFQSNLLKDKLSRVDKKDSHASPLYLSKCNSSQCSGILPSLDAPICENNPQSIALSVIAVRQEVFEVPPRRKNNISVKPIVFFFFALRTSNITEYPNVLLNVLNLYRLVLGPSP